MKKIYLPILMLLLIACENVSDVVVPAPLAMEAWIDNGDYPVVILTQALTPGVDEIAVADAMVRWGKVSISDGENTVLMSGGVSPDLFPPFSYRSFAWEGEVGKEYTITAEYEGRKAVATARILQPAEIMRVDFSRDAEGDVYKGSLEFMPPAVDDTCRFVLFTRVRNQEKRHFPAFMGTISTLPRAGATTIPVMRGRHIDTTAAYTHDFSEGDTVDIILARVEPQVYRFWDGYQDEVYFRDNIFVTTSQGVRGNVEGGYGVFSARGISRRVVRITPDGTEVIQ